MKRLPVFETILTVILASTALATQTIAFQTRAPRQLSVLTLPDQFAGYVRMQDPGDVANEELIRRTYTYNGRPFIIYMRQSLAFDRIHDLRDCLISNGFSPEEAGKYKVTDASGGTMETSIIKTHWNKSRAISLLWFQFGSVACPDRWAWRAQLLRHWKNPNELCKEYRVATPDTGDATKDLKALTELVRQLTLVTANR